MKPHQYTVIQWCKIFGIELIDNDGFTVDVKTCPVNLSTFVDGIFSCTISIVNRDKYSVLSAMSVLKALTPA
jgi:hypothetical protein